MTKHYAILLTGLLLLLAGRSSAQTESGNLEFTENKGQWDSRALLSADIGNGTLFFTANGLRVVLHDAKELDAYTRGHFPAANNAAKSPAAFVAAADSAAKAANASATNPIAGALTGARPASLRAHAYAVRFLNMSASATVVPDKPLDSYSNYLIGKDSTKWARNCRVYQGVTYKNVYPGIDIRYYTSDEKLKYDIIVHPGANPSSIVMQYDGVEGLTARSNRLSIKTSVGEVKELEPYSYQTGETSRLEIACRYKVGADKSVRFDIKNYDKTKVLVIDPTLVFSTFSGSKASNWGFTATPGPDGTFFAGGIVFGEGFPVSTGAFQGQFNNGKFDVGIIKLSSNGRNRIYATYIGGDREECPHSLFSDAQGNLAVIGRTYSGSSFPALNVYGTGNLEKAGCNIFVVKLNAAGNGILGSALVGGSGYDGANISDQVNGEGAEVAVSLIRNYGDDSRSEVIMDAAGDIFVASNSRSSNFPVTAGAFQKSPAGKQDGVLFKLSPDCKNMLFASYLGGSDNDACFVMKLNPLNGDIYVAGASASTNLPGSTAGTIQPANAGGISDGFISVVSNDGSTIRKTTYLGTTGFDAIYGIDFDRKGFPYVMGSTTGEWPTTANAVFINPGAKQFVCKFAQDLSAFVYSTTFGTKSTFPNISPVAFLVDRCENVYVSGWGGWLYSTTRDPYGLSGTIGMPVTSDAIKRTTDGRDFYFIVIQKNASALLYGTYFGQNDGAESISEHVDGGTSRYDQNGIIYQGICANCGAHSLTPFLTTPGSWSPRNGTGGHGCNLAAVKIAFNFAGVAADPKPLINGVIDSSGCVPLEVVFVDTIHNAKQYRWSFGDGTPDTTTSYYRIAHTFTAIGTYTVRLIAIDSNTCNVADTAYLHIRVRTDKAILNVDVAKLPPCASLTYRFTNSSIAPAGKPFAAGTFFWDFGDGTRVPGTSPITHTFAAPGTYPVKLILLDTNYCNYPDSLTVNLRVSPIVKAQFDVPSGCAPYTAFFNNTSLGGLDFKWDFGDGNTSTQVSPIYTYADTGTYTVRLIANDSSSCNKTDTTVRTLEIHSKPTAAFSTQPNPPQSNIPTTFVNGSSAATHYKYYFGDGDSAERNTADTVIHQYPESNTFQACLIAYNQYECTDTICHNVETVVAPLLDVPNAFTPGRFGQNSIITVKGFGVTIMTWKIYNRWGQLVFQSSNPNYGWDGTFKGVPQPMDVYGYTLEAQFNDGTKTTRKGDITLIR